MGASLLLCATTPAHAQLAWGVVNDVTTRPPSPTDDSSKGYSVGNLWNVPGGAEWICRSAAVGAASWEQLPPQPLPLDAVPGVALHGWGTRLLRAGYSGPLMTVSADGTTLTQVSADASGNLDRTALTTAVGVVPIISTSSSPQRWSIGVVGWADQAATAPANLSVPSGSVAPQISPRALSGGSPFVAFADGGMNWLTDVNGDASNIQHPRLFSSQLSGDAHNVSIVTVLRGGAAGNTLDAAVSYAGQFSITLNTQDVTQTSPLYGPASVSDGFQTSLGLFVPSTPSVLGFSASATGVTAFDDDNAAYSGPALLANVVAGGLYLGGLDATNNGFSDAFNAVITGPALSADQMLSLRESLTSTFRLTPQVRDRLIMAGASTEAGADGWLTQAPVRSAEAALKSPMVVYNLSIAGSGLSAAPNGANVIYTKGAAGLYAPYARNIYAIGAGSIINTIGSGTSVGDTYAAWALWLASVHNLGSNARTVCETVMPHHSVANESDRLAFNAAVRVSTTLCDATDDIGADPVFGDPSIIDSRVWTVQDGGHHSPFYQAQEGALLGVAVNKAMGF